MNKSFVSILSSSDLGSTLDPGDGDPTGVTRECRAHQTARTSTSVRCRGVRGWGDEGIRTPHSAEV